MRQLEFEPSWEVRISSRAQNKEAQFSNLMKHINKDTLHQAYKAVDGSKALGVDSISKSEYGKDLEENLDLLLNKIRKGTYRPQAKKEVLIPKANGKLRPIAIACFEDKLVDWVIGRILSTIYEPIFIKNSFGYRPNKSAENATKACYYSLEKNKRKFVFEIDFTSFFNTISHNMLIKVLREKIQDKNFESLIRRFLHSNILTNEGIEEEIQIGTPQGGIMSPVLANIYLHKVLDKWFIENYSSYNNIIVRYADDAVFFFKDESELLEFKADLEKRVKLYGLILNEEKTRVIKMSKDERNHFHFLGFTYYWGKQGKRRMLKVKTHKEKLTKAFRDFESWIKANRNKMKLNKLWDRIKSKVRGHFNYFGYWMNNLKLNHYEQHVIKCTFKWLNRRSQKRSYTWEGFLERIKFFPLIDDSKRYKLKQLGRSFGRI